MSLGLYAPVWACIVLYLRLLGETWHVKTHPYTIFSEE